MAPPLYQFVIDTIVQRIASGALAPGAMLPSEIDLGAELGVSQGTARKALSELEARGVVQRAQGRGTFVTVRTPESSLFNFFRLRNPDGTVVMPTLERERVNRRAATREEAALLYGAPSEVIEIERVRCLSGRPMIYEVSVVPVALFPGLADRTPLPNTLYVFYQQAYSCIIIRADEKIRAQAACERTVQALGCAPGTPVLEIDRLAYDISDRVVERRVSSSLTEDFCYTVSLRS